MIVSSRRGPFARIKNMMYWKFNKLSTIGNDGVLRCWGVGGMGRWGDGEMGEWKPAVGPKGLIGPPCHGVIASVIVCTYNRAQLLKRLLESLSCQTAPVDTFEIVVVDDGSGDNTSEVCRMMMERMPNLKYLAMGSNSGLSAAGNRGTAAARGQYLLFTDDDCIPDPGWVEKMCAVLRDSPLAAGTVVSPRSNYFKLCHNIAQFYPFMPGQEAQKLDFIAGANMGIQAGRADEIGVFNTGTIIPDMEYILRARQKGFTITYAPEAVVTHDPQRVTLGSVLAYAAGHAAETILLRHRFRELLRTPLVLFSPVLILLAAPVIALKTTAGIYLGNRKLLRCFHTIPLVYLIKLAWCWGAARGLLSEKRKKNHE
jgi:GT2 family glycosyltransferase